jgi:hypothetical protein
MFAWFAVQKPEANLPLSLASHSMVAPASAVAGQEIVIASTPAAAFDVTAEEDEPPNEKVSGAC